MTELSLTSYLTYIIRDFCDISFQEISEISCSGICLQCFDAVGWVAGYFKIFLLLIIC